MPQKRVSALASAINAAHVVTSGDPPGEGRDPVVTGITNDSRLVRPGHLYAALKGTHVDGHTFIDAAIAAGAGAVLCSDLPESTPPHVALFASAAPRFALSELSDLFFDHPSDMLDVIGVTGTDGKTSTVAFIHQLLGATGVRSAFLSTAATGFGNSQQANLLHQSTPEAPVIHEVLAHMVAEGARAAVLESTSHGLSPRTCRLAHVSYRAGVFTNLTHEHLEFHGTFEAYRNDKANLFRALDTGRCSQHPHFRAAALPPATIGGAPDGGKPDSGGLTDHESGTTIRNWGDAAQDVIAGFTRFGVVNIDSPDAGYFARATSQPVFGYSASGKLGALFATDIVAGPVGTQFTLHCDGAEARARLAIPGAFNVENALAAVLTVSLLTGTPPTELAARLENLRPVHGRMNVISTEPFSVVVDYAHTPGSFRSVLPFFREQTPGRLIVVFGSAGERDREKRPLQGAIADQFADIIVLTDEDPRGEPSMDILAEIATGCSRGSRDTIAMIPDRREAIAHALSQARPGDTVLLLGKGHEATIIAANETLNWDEERVAREELRRLGIEA